MTGIKDQQLRNFTRRLGHADDKGFGVLALAVHPDAAVLPGVAALHLAHHVGAVQHDVVAARLALLQRQLAHGALVHGAAERARALDLLALQLGHLGRQVLQGFAAVTLRGLKIIF